MGAESISQPRPKSDEKRRNKQSNSIKAANEFGVTKTMKLAGLLMFINDVHSLGLKTTQGMYLTDSWYWNRDPEARIRPVPPRKTKFRERGRR